jgi:uncharacterized protein YndB with AHSA1/START domain
MSAAGDKAVVTVTVQVSLTDAFEVFTQETDLWWRRGPKYRVAGRRPGALQFEQRSDGRLFETYESAAGPQLFEIGRVTVWEPPHRLVFRWRNPTFAPEESTEVEVRFVELPSGNTQVTVEHRGWAALRDDHPARHGNVGAAMSRMIGLHWGELLAAMREYVSARV